MKVYVLQSWCGDYYRLEGVYSTAEKASDTGAMLIERGSTDEIIVIEYELDVHENPAS